MAGYVIAAGSRSRSPADSACRSASWTFRRWFTRSVILVKVDGSAGRLSSVTVRRHLTTSPTAVSTRANTTHARCRTISWARSPPERSRQIFSALPERRAPEKRRAPENRCPADPLGEGGMPVNQSEFNPSCGGYTRKLSLRGRTVSGGRHGRSFAIPFGCIGNAPAGKCWRNKTGVNAGAFPIQPD
jgi:hypothetical protein